MVMNGSATRASLMNRYSFRNNFHKFIKKNQLLKKGDKVLAAVSGGVDSTLMLHLLCDNIGKYGIELSVIHFNHQLRGKEAERDAKFVEKLTTELNIPFYFEKLNVKGEAKKLGTSIQDAGHILRRKKYADYVEKYKFNKIATAHHRDDQLETLLMRLIGGAGPVGMSGISIKDGYYIRPLLFCDRSEIEEYAKSQKIEWVEDSSNKKGNYVRNRLRNDVIPVLKLLNPSAADVASRSARMFGQLSEELQKFSKEIFDKSLISKKKSEIILAIPPMSNYFNMIGYYVIDNALKCIDKESPTVLSRQFDDLFDLVQTGDTGMEISLSNGFKVLKDRSSIVIYKDLDVSEAIPLCIGDSVEFGDMILETSVTGWKKNSKLPEGNDHEVVDHKLIYGNLLKIRSWKDGDRFQPLGFNGTKNISDLLTEKKIRLNKKRRISVLECGDEIIWVCGVRLSEKFKVSETTKEVVHLKIKSINLN
ncbi:tRNA lysidine(34) synthetase TilS [Candidatus Marinimicrobia bacterium MT.SAG.2]|nr:tRNA lysidine(34) synthetase TilS [Candidatus Marinimicrobia bacterium MT.SAG.2]